MCLIVFAWHPGTTQPLVVAANRDEFHARPSQPLGEWPDAPGLYAGRDLESGGTWMGMTRTGRFAALTNIRDPQQPLGRISRGSLTEAFLRGQDAPLPYLQAVAAHCEAFTGFNLLVGDGGQLGFLNARERVPCLLSPGVYGLSNAGLDTPWPKLIQAREALQRCLPMADPAELLGLLMDRCRAPDEELPNTGVPLDRERLLSSVFIQSTDYGTRASTVMVQRAGGFDMVERRFDPQGQACGEVVLKIGS